MLLRIRAICEGNPEERLCRLLERQKFEEAEKFAEQDAERVKQIERQNEMKLCLL